MDKTLIRRRFARAADSYDSHAAAQRHIARRLCALLKDTMPGEPGPTLEIGCGTGLFTHTFRTMFRPGRLVLNDICPESLDRLADMQEEGVRLLAGDAEHIGLPGDQGLVVACSVIQWFDAPEQFLLRCADLLRPGGWLAVSTFGPDNLREVAALTGRRLDYRTLDALCQAVAPHFSIRHAAGERLVLRFNTPHDVLRHLRATGVTGLGHTIWTRGRLSRFDERYRSLFPAADGGGELTYHPIYLIAKKKETCRTYIS